MKDGSVLALVPGGVFEMGDGQGTDCAKHRVHMDGYYIGVYCVTNGQYAAFVKATGHRAPDKADYGSAVWTGGRCPEEKLHHPVVCVSWDDAMAYAKWSGCELATEAQWEKAARGLQELLYPWGNDWDAGKCRNHKNKGRGETCAVWEYPDGASGYGTYNQSGNVWEWCRDWYGDKYYSEQGAGRNPAGPSTGSYRVYRGGCWYDGGASYCRGALRDWHDPAYRIGDLGFRLVRTV
jgi:formylglycine-generating enzyme required for sulfatase activity